MSFKKIFHEENRQQTDSLKTLLFYQRKIDKSQTVCMMTDEKNSLHGWHRHIIRLCITRHFINCLKH